VNPILTIHTEKTKKNTDQFLLPKPSALHSLPSKNSHALPVSSTSLAAMESNS